MPVDKAARALAYHAIDTEREYQEKTWPDRPGIPTPTIDAFAAYIQGYANILTQTCATTRSAEKKLDVMRKVAGLCVACFEQHGVPERKA